MDWNEIKQLTKLVSRYDPKTNDWEYLEIVNVNDLMGLGLDSSNSAKSKSAQLRQQ